MEPALEPLPEATAEQQLETRKVSLVDRALALKVTDADTYTSAAELGSTISVFIAEAEAHFGPDIKAAYDLHRSLCDKRNAVIDPLKRAKESLAVRASQWHRAEEVKRLAEQRRLEEVARQRQLAEERRLQAEAEEARKAGETERAQELQEEVRQVQQAPAPTPVVPSSVPKLRTASAREKWTFRVTDMAALVAAIATPMVLKAAIEELKAQPDLQSASAAVTRLEQLLADAPLVPIGCLDVDAVYLRGRAKTDHDTLDWPGVDFFDEGSMAFRK